MTSNTLKLGVRRRDHIRIPCRRAGPHPALGSASRRRGGRRGRVLRTQVRGGDRHQGDRRDPSRRPASRPDGHRGHRRHRPLGHGLPQPGLVRDLRAARPRPDPIHREARLRRERLPRSRRQQPHDLERPSGRVHRPADDARRPDAHPSRGLVLAPGRAGRVREGFRACARGAEDLQGATGGGGVLHPRRGRDAGGQGARARPLRLDRRPRRRGRDHPELHRRPLLHRNQRLGRELPARRRPPHRERGRRVLRRPREEHGSARGAELGVPGRARDVPRRTSRDGDDVAPGRGHRRDRGRRRLGQRRLHHAAGVGRQPQGLHAGHPRSSAAGACSSSTPPMPTRRSSS